MYYISKKMTENEISGGIIRCAIEVHKNLGPGLLESAYQECLAYELVQNGFYVSREVPRPIIYKEVKLDHGYRMDLLVDNRVVIEIKSVEAITEVHEAQLLTYLRLGNYKQIGRASCRERVKAAVFVEVFEIV